MITIFCTVCLYRAFLRSLGLNQVNVRFTIVKLLFGIVETRLKLALIVLILEEREALITPMKHILNTLVVRR